MLILLAHGTERINIKVEEPLDESTGKVGCGIVGEIEV